MRALIASAFVLSSVSLPSFAADDAFFHEAARAGLAEIALGELATARGSSEGVRAFGRRMVDEHRAANVKLQAAAAKSGVKLPTDLSPDAQAIRSKLQSLTGSAFDQAYSESQSQAHAKTVELFKKQIAVGTDPAAKAWASDELPMVTRHAEMIGGLGEMPGEHSVEHATGTPGPAEAPPATAAPSR